ncbi:hypothetical protein ACFFRR_001901 [Megaselia abdita]
MELSGKNVCYVGGFGGIGIASIKVFLTKSIANLYILDLLENQELLESLRKQFPKTNIYYEKFDITSSNCIKNTLDKVIYTIRNIDVFVNGAGVLWEDKVEEMIAINLTGLINTTKAVRNIMDKSKGGKGGIILNIASLAGLASFPCLESYCATKHAVVGFTKSLSNQSVFEKTGISMITLCPGCTETPILNNLTNLEAYKVQPVDVVGEYLVKCVEIEKNGGIYLIDDSVGREIEQNPYYLN